MVMPCDRHNKRYAWEKERRRLNRSSSTPSGRIMLSHSFAMSAIFSFKYFYKSFSLTIVMVVMLQQSQRTDATNIRTFLKRLC